MGNTVSYIKDDPDEYTRKKCNAKSWDWEDKSQYEKEKLAHGLYGYPDPDPKS